MATVKQTYELLLSQIQAGLGLSQQLPSRSFEVVFSKAVAGLFALLYKYAGFMFLQMFVSRASTEEIEVNGVKLVPLVEWGRLIGVPDPVAATKTEIQATVTVTNQNGYLVAGTQVINPSNSAIYLVKQDVALDAATVTVTLVASSEYAGSQWNLDTGAVLSFANALPNVLRALTVSAETVTGADAETWGAYRQRVVDRFKKRPQGGALVDYELWGEEAAGVINVYPYTSDCPGQVDLYVESGTEVDGIPTAAQLQAVVDIVNIDTDGLATRRPACALVNAFPITRTGFDVTVSGLNVSNPAQVTASITASLEEFLLSREPYIIGVSSSPRKDRITAGAIAAIIEDIVAANGGVYNTFSLSLDSNIITAYSLGVGEKSKLNTVVFTQ